MCKPEISVVICTRNRGASIVPALESVFANQHPSYEVIVVDQSTDDETQAAVAPFLADPCFQYIYSDTVGIGKSRNIGLQAARGEFVAYTDDDCTVPPDWLDKLQGAFRVDPLIAIVFCAVFAGPHDPSQGYIPTYEIKENRLAQRIEDVLGGIGLGAGMAVNRQVITELGGFDNNLGIGTRFLGGEDHDIALRALINLYKILDLKDTAVTHYGFRTWQEGRSHTRDYWFSGGATYIKPLRCGYPEGAKMLFSRPILNGLKEPLVDLLRLRKPRGLMRLVYICEGLIAGFFAPLDREKMLYINGGDSLFKVTKTDNQQGIIGSG